MAAGKYCREDCIALLREKQEQLRQSGESRFPQRADFSAEEVIAIKAFLGPWPRALEAAGLKEPRPELAEKKLEKRRRSQQRKRTARQEKASVDTAKTRNEHFAAGDDPESRLYLLLTEIRPLDREAMSKASQRQAQLAKPPGSLGRLEDLSVQLAGITGSVHNQINHKTLLVFSADNGVVEEGVSCTPQSVTLSQTINLVRAKTGASVLAKHFGCALRVCDVGVKADITEPGVLNRKIAYGTHNIANEPAMTRQQAVQALLTGFDLAVSSAEEGADVIGIGEMGIGNTTTSSAILAVLTGAEIRAVTGRGGGLTEEGYKKKIQVIQHAIERNHPDKNDVIDVLSKVGGFDIAAMAGAFLGAAFKRIPVVIDGFISVVAALCAARLCENAREYLVPSHASFEIGYRLAMKELQLEPLFDLRMRLGEGSGCPIAFTMLEAACTIINDMATFSEASIDDSYLEPIRGKDVFTVKEGQL